jgi:hypothetical protein
LKHQRDNEGVEREREREREGDSKDVAKLNSDKVAVEEEAYSE